MIAAGQASSIPDGPLQLRQVAQRAPFVVDEGSVLPVGQGRNVRQAVRAGQPEQEQDSAGRAGEERWLDLELKLIADVGFVGLPNAGKSTLLARISRARPRIAPYPFTTLEPHLGIVALDEERQFVAADLPGLIAGAHEGRGLGHQFLRHVERTRVLLFLVEAGAEAPAHDLETLEREVSLHSPALLEKPRRLVITKGDLVAPEERAAAPARLGLPGARLISAHSGEGVTALLEELWGLIAADLAREQRELLAAEHVTHARELASRRSRAPLASSTTDDSSGASWPGGWNASSGWPGSARSSAG